ncbi:MAG: hypothetical protein PHD41_07230 [Methanosarcinaceae archaeon]|nr:hypothetical protein [Methanosarcinaceae archaeon]MDD4331426.1 hypothetical protein [Methanosarcinaceae archaeon]MDD4748829.1 hypothetical protein [Methanosarcinaceae archaeon]
MSGNKKILPVRNQPSLENKNPKLKQASKNPNHEIQLGCGCGSASCEGCAGALGVKAGSEKEVVFRNVAIFLTIVLVVILGTLGTKWILTTFLS